MKSHMTLLGPFHIVAAALALGLLLSLFLPVS